MKTPQEAFIEESTKLREAIIKEVGTLPKVDDDGIVRIFDGEDRLRYEEKPGEYAKHFSVDDESWTYKWEILNGECRCSSEDYGFGEIIYSDGIKRVYQEFDNKQWLAEEQTDSTTTRFDEYGNILTVTEKQIDGGKVTKSGDGDFLFAMDKDNNITLVSRGLDSYEKDYLLDAWHDLGVKFGNVEVKDGNTVLKILNEDNSLQLKMDMLREKLGNKVGKTDKYSDKDLKEHMKIAKETMKFARIQRGGIGNN